MKPDPLNDPISVNSYVYAYIYMVCIGILKSEKINYKNVKSSPFWAIEFQANYSLFCGCMNFIYDGHMHNFFLKWRKLF